MTKALICELASHQLALRLVELPFLGLGFERRNDEHGRYLIKSFGFGSGAYRLGVGLLPVLRLRQKRLDLRQIIFHIGQGGSGVREKQFALLASRREELPEDKDRPAQLGEVHTTAIVDVDGNRLNSLRPFPGR